MIVNGICGISVEKRVNLRQPIFARQVFRRLRRSGLHCIYEHLLGKQHYGMHKVNKSNVIYIYTHIYSYVELLYSRIESFSIVP
jgi:hypothetical protein